MEVCDRLEGETCWNVALFEQSVDKSMIWKRHEEPPLKKGRLQDLCFQLDGNENTTLEQSTSESRWPFESPCRMFGKTSIETVHPKDHIESNFANNSLSNFEEHQDLSTEYLENSMGKPPIHTFDPTQVTPLPIKVARLSNWKCLNGQAASEREKPMHTMCTKNVDYDRNFQRNLSWPQFRLNSHSLSQREENRTDGDDNGAQTASTPYHGPCWFVADSEPKEDIESVPTPLLRFPDGPLRHEFAIIKQCHDRNGRNRLFELWREKELVKSDIFMDKVNRRALHQLIYKYRIGTVDSSITHTQDLH